MKKRLAGILASVLVLMGNMGITANAANTSLSKSYRNAYKKILSQNKDFQGVYIGDLTGDSREELLVATNEFGAFKLYVPVGKKIKKYSFKLYSLFLILCFSLNFFWNYIFLMSRLIVID